MNEILTGLWDDYRLTRRVSSRDILMDYLLEYPEQQVPWSLYPGKLSDGWKVSLSDKNPISAKYFSGISSTNFNTKLVSSCPLTTRNNWECEEASIVSGLPVLVKYPELIGNYPFVETDEWGNTPVNIRGEFTLEKLQERLELLGNYFPGIPEVKLPSNLTKAEYDTLCLPKNLTYVLPKW